MIECCNCGVHFGMTADYEARRREDHRDFYCPNGHPQRFNGPTEKEKRITALEQQLAERERLLASANADLAKPWRCPHCPRRYVGRDGLLGHVTRTHGAKAALSLPAKAGPDARGDMGIKHNVVAIGGRK